MTKLSVNVNKLATLRNSRGKNNPNLIVSSKHILDYGGEGITVHPRPDERHIRRADVYELKKQVTDVYRVELNIEGYPSPDFLKLVEDVQPAQATLVPDPPEALTSNAGWDLETHQTFLSRVATALRAQNIRSSFFIDPLKMTDAQFSSLEKIGADRVELYTEAYAESYGTPKQDEVTQTYKLVAAECRFRGLGINAGHDLNRENLKFLVQEIPFIDEVSIGHALICDSIELGLRETIRQYLACLV